MTGRCPTPEKRAFTTRGRAIKAAMGASWNYAHGMRVYRCACGRFHLTSQVH